MMGQAVSLSIAVQIWFSWFRGLAGVRLRLMRWLVCPICSGTLGVHTLRVFRSSITDDEFALLDQIAPMAHEREVETEIITGALTCEKCHVYYPIHNGVPRMLTYATRVAEVHRQANREWIQKRLKDLTLPACSAPPGEREIARNFSTEWTNYEWSGKSYWLGTPEAVLDWMRFSLGTSRHSLEGKLVLEAGIGIGGIADGLSQSERCEIVGIDLSYSVDQAARYFRHNPLLHIVQASIFALPFRSATFDAVYSQGVLHHTYSPKDAFIHLALLPKNNAMLYVWVYSHADASANLLRRALMLIERTLRPAISRMPGPIQTVALAPAIFPYILYQNLVRRRKLGREKTASYGWSEALHAARDRLTPKFASRHTYEEVATWFESQSYGELEFLRDESLPVGFPEALTRCVGVRGFLKRDRSTPEAPTASVETQKVRAAAEKTPA
jgi:uncharacterized protein YbaR (Trm112 family)